MEKDDIHFHDEFTGLTIYTREATYSSNKHFGSFVFWELVDLFSNALLIFILLVLWEYFDLRSLFIK